MRKAGSVVVNDFKQSSLYLNYPILL